MEANKTVLILKYVRIIKELAIRKNISYEQAMDMFYRSKTSRMIAEGAGNLHCMSAGYLAEEIEIEYEMEKNVRDRQMNRLRAYKEAFSKVIHKSAKDTY